MSNSRSDKMDIIYVIAFIAYMILVLIRCRLRFTRRRIAYNAEMEQQISGRIAQEGAGLSDEDRREYIRERLLIKKAESQKDFSIHDDIESGSNNNIADDNGDESQEEETAKNESADKNSTIGIKSIFESIKDGVMSDTSSHYKSDDMDNLDSTKTCPICFEEYAIGDEICSSRNDACPHVYHAECLTNWLMKHDDCPLCRADYLHLPAENRS